MFYPSETESKVFARSLLKKLALHERAQVQASFLEKLSQTPLFDQLILRGACALHGVFLGQRNTQDIDFIATSEVGLRFCELAQEYGLPLERSHTHDGVSEYALAGKIYNRVSVGIDVWIRSEELPSELTTLKFPRRTNIPVRVLPLVYILSDKLESATNRRYEVDFLDLWFGLTSSNTAVTEVKEILRGRPALYYNLELALGNLDSLESTWEENLDALLAPIPKYEMVRRDLHQILPSFAPNK